jgi:UDP-3-O-[3-hydroxymyristoyl] glucosamine N-acyltransferase
MSINSSFIRNLGLDLTVDVEFSTLGLINSGTAKTLTFIDDMKFLKEIRENTNLSGIFVNYKSEEAVKEARPDMLRIICDDPRYYFYLLQNTLTERFFEDNKFISVISPTAKIHSKAYVSDYNVVIGENVEIQANVSILPDVEIGDNSVVRAGTVIGSEGFEHKRTSKGILSVKHDGKVLIGKKVDIGANCAISKGFGYRHTKLGDDTKLDNLVHIAHGVQIGERCFLPAACMIAGSTTLGDDVWIGPGASISSQISIGDNAYVTIGSVVTKNVEAGDKVTGNFALKHEMFLRVLKNNIKEAQND